MMELSPLLKIFSVFAAMLVLGRLKVPLGASLVLGGLAINWWGGNSIPEVFKNFIQALAQVNLWLLVAVTALTVEFGRELADRKNAAAMQSLGSRLGGKSGRMWSLMIIPALIGLMPMPAGALLSAPLVQQNVHEPHWKPEWKAAVNYWFRHVWEYWWPIYTAVIIGIAVFKMETWRFIATTFPFTPAAIIFGYWFLVRPHRARLRSGDFSAPHDLRKFLNLIWPLLVIIAFVLVMPPITARFFPWLDAQTNKLIAMLAGIICGLGMIWLRARNEAGLFASFFKKHNLNILMTVGSIMIFQYLLEKSGLLPAASQKLVNSGISIIPIIAILPFLAGFITGIASGFAGIAFPIVAGLIGAGTAGMPPMAALALAFGFGYMGMLVSPIHLCLLMTRDYFSASLWPIYRQLLPCVALQTVFIVVVFVMFKGLNI